jgi:1,2-dihydroxy-3-keto-5-methylthiopentene dioxygenase
MSILAVYSSPGVSPRVAHDFDEIEETLGQIGVLFERWEANRPVTADADQAGVLSAYQDSIDRLNDRFGFQSADVVSLKPDHPQKEQLRKKFLAEHVHSDFEVRFFVDGKGLFYIHKDHHVYLVLCTKGDLISVPANTAHWFDMGTEPCFQCIRLFTTADGWVADFTGSNIAGDYPDFDAFVQMFEPATA